MQEQRIVERDIVTQAGPRRSRILIVEDERHVAKLLDYFLSRAGYEVRVASDAEEALVALSHYEPDALLLDLVLPGMSGLEFLQTIRGPLGKKDLVVIVLSAQWFAPDDPTLQCAGATAQCGKPIAPTTLMRKLQDLGVHPQHVEKPGGSVPEGAI